jgi:ABC-type lipoprotein release transport system permease subunit
MILRIAWRNIWRSRNRSLVIIGSIGLGLWAALFLTAFYNGAIEQRIRSAIDTEIAHIQVHHPKFREDFDLQYRLPEANRILDSVRGMTGVQAATGRIVLQGMASSASGSAGVNVQGVMPSREAKVSRLYAFVQEGNYLRDSGKHEILVGRKLMQKLKLQQGSKLVLTFNDVSGNIASGAFRIAGVYETVNTPYDASQVFIHVREAAELTGLGSDMNQVAILLKEDGQADAVARSLADRWPQNNVQTWKEISPEMQLLVVSFDRMILVYMGIIVLALTFGIVNTMMMSVLERTREIGMLLSLGMNKARVFAMITLETLLLVLAGCPGGIIASLLTIMVTRKSGINLEIFSDVFSSFGYSNLIFPSLSARQFLMMMALVVFSALVSAIFPARRALSLKPAEAVRK